MERIRLIRCCILTLHRPLLASTALAISKGVVYIRDLSAHQTPKEVRNARYPRQGKRAV
jgi:hypothetical protein